MSSLEPELGVYNLGLVTGPLETRYQDPSQWLWPIKRSDGDIVVDEMSVLRHRCGSKCWQGPTTHMWCQILENLAF